MNGPTLLWAEGVRYERVGHGKEQRQSPALEAVRITSGTLVPGTQIADMNLRRCAAVSFSKARRAAASTSTSFLAAP